jgi:hypothetical protein
MKRRDATQCIYPGRLIRLQSAILLLLFVLVIALTVMRFQRDSDMQAIKDVVTTAMVTPVSITVGNLAPFNQLPGSITPASLQQTNINVSLARANAHAIFSRIYAPGCSDCWIFASNIDTSLVAETKGQFHGLGGGIRDIEWRQVLIDGSTASVTIAATMWSRYAYLDQQGNVQINTPTGQYLTTYTLTKIATHWLITNQLEDGA